MKHCVRIVLTACCICFAYCVSAQSSASTKKSLFHQYPAQLTCAAEQLDQLFNAGKGAKASLDLSGNLRLEGTITHRISKYNQLETVGISLPAFDHILLSVTRRYDAQHQPVFAAQLMSPRHADGYLLSRQKDGTYRFSKISTDELLPVCSH